MSNTENLDIVIIKDEQQAEKKYSADPLDDNGHYALTIPVSAGNTQVGIAFGKNYSKVQVNHIDLMDAASQPPLVHCNVDCFQMAQGDNNVFECKSTSGMLILNINLQEVGKRNLKHMLRVEFHPMAVWEKVDSDSEIEV